MFYLFLFDAEGGGTYLVKFLTAHLGANFALVTFQKSVLVALGFSNRKNKQNIDNLVSRVFLVKFTFDQFENKGKYQSTV